MDTVSINKSHGGEQGVYKHASDSTGTEMIFSVFVPPHEAGAKLPVLWYLSGLTCDHSNVTEKGEYRAACAEEGVIFIAPDTSPRGDDVPDEDGYDFGKGAGFYLDATQDPWAQYYRMRSYIEDELPALIAAEFPMADMARQSITGHSMGGHGALTIGLRGGERFRSVSAFSPVVAPIGVPWGQKALSKYLGEDRAAWRQYDACALIADGARVPELLVEQGTADQFLDEQLRPELLREACEKAGIDLTLNMREGYDHSYYFISTFLGDHIRWHAERLKR
ncbi:S-formylglutathione hydrolase [Novosphingopyxis iocasae]|uniref:S-formylglutathione hydrolase n=1 Tax=Novosphingopyxis iocasae TaxID=2762729 RepID=UPI001651A4A2|nr:S-formylglutathione hydrolase [Novosphingopyxis iocasae]